MSVYLNGISRTSRGDIRLFAELDEQRRSFPRYDLYRHNPRLIHANASHFDNKSSST